MRRIATFFLVALFAARSLLPMGMMLQATPASGGVQVVICTATGTKLVTLNSEGMPVTENGDVDRRGSGEDATKICPYAMAAMMGAPDQHFSSLSETVRYTAVEFRIAVQLARAEARSSGESARGPPALLG